MWIRALCRSSTATAAAATTRRGGFAVARAGASEATATKGRSGPAGAAAAFAAAAAAYGLQQAQVQGGTQCAGESPADLCARLSEGLPLTRDLTSTVEAMKCLLLATEILTSGLSIEEIKKVAYKEPAKTPAILLSAVGSADSKLKLQKCGPHHMTCIFAMHGEQNQLRTQAEHENGQDLLHMKVAQLEWLFDGEKGKTWDIVAVDNGCSDDIIGLVRKMKMEEGMTQVKLINLQEAIDGSIHFFKEERGLKNTKESREGAAILYALQWAAKQSASTKKGLFGSSSRPHFVMYTDSDLSTDMSLCGLLSAGIMTDGCSMSMGARYGVPESFLVKDKSALGHPESHYDQPNMMKIVFRHYLRLRLLPMLTGFFDTQCAFKCFKIEDIPQIIDKVQSMGRDFDTDLLLCALQFYQKQGIPQNKLCKVYGTLFTEDFAESNFMASADDPDKNYKTYGGMMDALVGMHERFIEPDSEEAKAAKDLAEFCRGMPWETYKKMHDKLNERGLTLFDHPFALDELKAAAA
mmetsp:Transcript_94675/g.306225  ORF Transcript_94675/g.306225 Transcript_94675/m.306225 type:complete len:522 (+) Transcript_94675:104-1669(+)